MTKIYISTPCIDGKVHAQYAVSLAETKALLSRYGIQTDILIRCGCSFLPVERNRIVSSFLKSDCTHLLCVDSDLGWPAESVVGLILAQEEFIAGVYPARGEKSFTFRPCLKEDGSLITNPEKNLLKMESIPAGFMLIRRSAIEKMISFHEQDKFSTDDGKEGGFVLFNSELVDGKFWGEDYVFCRKAIEAGVDIWVDPSIQFDHAGNIGMLAEVLTNTPPEQNKD